MERSWSRRLRKTGGPAKKFGGSVIRRWVQPLIFTEFNLAIRTSKDLASLSRESLPVWGTGSRPQRRSLYARLMAVFRTSLWRESDGPLAIPANTFRMRPPAQIQPSKTGDASPDSSSPSTPRAARLRPWSSSRTQTLAIGDESRASGRARSPIRLSTG
jgi:hypothetical protein